MRKEKIKEDTDKNKKIADSVKTKEKEYQEKKRLMEIEKMLKMKQELIHFTNGTLFIYFIAINQYLLVKIY